MLDAVIIALGATAVVFFVICIFGLVGDRRRHNPTT
jgi:hypothetical protein